MAGLEEDMGIQEKVQLVLRGPDGKIKQEIKTEPVIVTPEGDVFTEGGEDIRN